MSTIPDLIAPLISWRVWRVDHSPDHKGHFLASLNETIWLPGEPATATCPHLVRRPDLQRHGPAHEAPMNGCICGIYAAKERDDLQSFLSWGLPDLVAGRVALWGKVIVHEKGFRAAKAYPIEILIPRDERDPLPAERMARDLLRYGVEIKYWPVSRPRSTPRPRPATA